MHVSDSFHVYSSITLNKNRIYSKQGMNYQQTYGWEPCTGKFHY